MGGFRPIEGRERLAVIYHFRAKGSDEHKMSVSAAILGSMDQEELLQEAAEAAEKILRENSVSRPPVRMTELPRKYGYKISAQSFPPSFTDLLGVLAHDDKLIVVNEKERAEVQNCSIARLFALDLLWSQGKVNPPVERGLYLLRDRPLLAQKSQAELRGDMLAAYLLVPRFFLTDYRPFASVTSLAELFVVPEDFLSWRLSFERSR